MRVPLRSSIISAIVGFHLLIVIGFAGFFAQTPQKSASPSPEASLSTSPSPTPPRTPSPTPLPGAQNFHQWGSITVFNGLPSDSVRAIAQTSDGVMWFGTDNGLARFDGRRVQNFSLGSSDADRVLSLKTSPAGELLVGTRGGAFVYSERSFQPVENTAGIVITAILAEPEIYLVTDDGNALRIRYQEGGAYFAEKIFAEPIRGADGNPLAITSIFDVDGELLVGTSGRGALVVKDGSVAEYAASPRPTFVNSLARS
ncbi:MAG: two-component regulator propeller domain-containing protein, partial [Pyrinomonadaceae bacterium]